MSLVDILRAYPRLQELQDYEVKAALERLKQRDRPSDIDIAGASLGDSYQAVDKLVEADVLPESLTKEQRAELRDELGVSDVNSKVIRRNRARVAEWLGLRGGVSVEGYEVPDKGYGQYTLFPHQRKALSDIRDLLEEYRNRVVVHMPTGSGKTRTTMNYAAEWLRRNEPTVVTWLASTTELCEQAVEEFIKAWGYLGDREVQIQKGWGGEEWDAASLSDGLLVSTPQTLRSRKQARGSKFVSAVGRATGLIIFDEAHQAIAPTFRDVTEHLSATGPGGGLTPVIGLTATPGRTFFGGEKDDELVEFFSGNKVTLNTEVSGGPANPVQFLIEKGYLADPSFELLVPDESRGNWGGAGNAHGQTVNYNLDDHQELVMDPIQYLRVVTQAVLSLINEGHRRILVFAASVRLSAKIAAVLRALGVRAESVDSDTPTELRAGAIARYRSGGNDTRVLTNYGVLTTGFDAPQTSAAVIARPTQSVVLYNQMVGRAIRGPKAGGNQTAKIITVVDPSVPAFGSIADAFSHWEDLWDE